MNIETDYNSKLAIIWLTNADQQDPAIMKQVEDIISENKANKIKSAIMRSGGEDLFTSTDRLITNNFSASVSAQN